MSKYIHTENVHNLRDPELLVPEILKMLNPKSVVDIGCGLATFLSIFKRYGVSDILGIDGKWVNKELLFKNINPNEFLEQDLEQLFILKKKYDLVLSLEVAEHIHQNYADIFVENLVNSGEVILFSAAIPNQGGQNHINEQWLSYWEEKFSKFNYKILDVIRPIIWDNSEIFWWYKQNTVLFVKKTFKISDNYKIMPITNIVHYELYLEKSDELEKIKKNKTFFIIKEVLFFLFGFELVKKTKNLFFRGISFFKRS